jgi:hypothetical protein
MTMTNPDNIAKTMLQILFGVFLLATIGFLFSQLPFKEVVGCLLLTVGLAGFVGTGVKSNGVPYPGIHVHLLLSILGMIVGWAMIAA